MTHPHLIDRMFGGYIATDTAIQSCNCIDPQNGQPLCPCAMRGVQIIDGRYVRVTDLGPAPSASQAFTKEYSEYTRLMGDERMGE